MDLIHGGDVTGFELTHGYAPLDFSASLNPLGLPAGVAKAAHRAVENSTPYPDPLCRRLRAALAKRLQQPAEWIFCANGAADVIYRLVMAKQPKTALIPVPAFEEYEQALATVDCRVDFHMLSEENDFLPDEKILKRITPGLDLLFWCQPNNPTGHLTDPDLMDTLLRRCADAKVMLVVDECFCHFVDQPERFSLLGKIRDFPNLFIIDSFTKLYAMAGIRLGYGITSDISLLEKIYHSGQPWTVSTIAQEAGLAALEEDDYVAESLALIGSEKVWMKHQLARLGIRVIGSAANYLFFSGAAELSERLAEKGILIRSCGNFRGLTPGFVRIAVRGRADNERLLQAMAVVMSQ